MRSLLWGLGQGAWTRLMAARSSQASCREPAKELVLRGRRRALAAQLPGRQAWRTHAGRGQRQPHAPCTSNTSTHKQRCQQGTYLKGRQKYSVCSTELQ